MLRKCLNARSGHLFDPWLLQGQLDTLEELRPDEAIQVSIELTPGQIIDLVMQKLGVESPYSKVGTGELEGIVYRGMT